MGSMYHRIRIQLHISPATPVKLNDTTVSLFFHMKCLYLDPEYHDDIRENICPWMCPKCNTVFPFNAIEDDVDFTQACGATSGDERMTSNLIYNPFDLNETDYIIGSVYDTDISFIVKTT